MEASPKVWCCPSGTRHTVIYPASSGNCGEHFWRGLEIRGLAMVSLRRAVETDVGAVHDLAGVAFGKYVARMGGVEPMPMSADYAALVAAGHVWIAVQDGVVASEGGVIAGFVVLLPKVDDVSRDGHLELDVIAVHPQQQGRGIGAALMTLAEEEALRQGLPAVTLYTNEAMTENLEYYPRRGYQQVGRETVGPFHRVLFRKVLRKVL